jgi:hypothetical protein
MRPFGAWFGRLAMAGACLVWAGCGRSDVPDPDSDSRAATSEPSSPTVDKGSRQAAADDAPAKADPNAMARNDSPAPEADKPPPSEKPADDDKATPPATKGDASGTDEMLKNNGSPGGSTPQAAPPAGGSPPGGSSPGGPAPSVPGGGAAQDAPPSTPPGPGAGGGPSPGVPPQNGPPQNGNGNRNRGPGGGNGGMGMRPGANQQNARGVGGAPGAPGGPGFGMPGPMNDNAAGGRPGGMGAAGGNASSAPVSFHYPNTAVEAFLAALKARDKDRLTQATAKRAATEADEKHRKIFASILEGSLGDDELDEMGKALDGFRVMQVLPAKSTGRISVVVGKQDGRDYLQRTIVTRKEQEGWKVMDITNMLEFKPGLPALSGGRGRRR